ncbi:copper amine oxidase N-terminal domain-containing protein [Saccharibacillus kuerlensis]|uniref:Copper amine oxidase-like N-terminal domain-containing protein n=1 Tax=Saccharibacillus kuerlensis TaxID=459527 RepID=A0ABQ2L771_9BACL|nr:copper amine oxidase N-terminal domain-containing protein [Saccharibacillus kuerlensis]GGO05611.1 hypothetical protein GCM10010969_32250 [Saccharibacillus kuerlensis]
MRGFRMKKIAQTAVLTLAAAGLIVPLAAVPSEALAAKPDPTVYINGRITSGDVLVRNGVTYLTLTDLRALGSYTFRYDKTRRTVTIKDGRENDTYVLTLGSANARQNGETIRMNAAPLLYGNKTMIPVRAAADLFDAELQWDQNGNRVMLTKENESGSGGSTTMPSRPFQPPVSPPGPSGPTVPTPPKPPTLR